MNKLINFIKTKKKKRNETKCTIQNENKNELKMYVNEKWFKRMTTKVKYQHRESGTTTKERRDKNEFMIEMLFLLFEGCRSTHFTWRETNIIFFLSLGMLIFFCVVYRK